MIETINVRLDPELLQRIEEYAQEIEAQVGVRVTRSEVVRSLVTQALDLLRRK